MSHEKLYVNNETLGNIEYMGTRDEWKKAMRIPGEEWWRDAVWAAEEAGESGPTFEEYMEDMLDKGLVEASEEKMNLDRVL